MPISKTQLKRNVFWNTMGTGFNAIYSTVLMILIAHLGTNGIASTGQFSYAYHITGLFATIGYYGGRVYHISDTGTKYNDNDYISVRYLASIIMIAIVTFFCIINLYSIEKTALILILIGFRAFEAISDGYYGILQKNDDLEHAGKSLIMRSVFASLLFIVLFVVTNNMVIASLSFLIVSFLNTTLYDRKKSMQYEKLAPRINNKTKMLMKECFPTFILAFFALLVLNISRYFVDLRLTDTDQGYFGIIILPATVMVLIIQFIIQPFFKMLIDSYHQDYKKYKEIKRKIILSVVFISIIVIILAYLFGSPVFSLLYGYSFDNYRLLIALSVLAGSFYGLVIIISNLLTISRKINIQNVLYTIITVLGVIYSYFTIYDLNSAIYSYLVIMFIAFVAFFITDLVISKRKRLVSVVHDQL